jgi:hypothetical protein
MNIEELTALCEERGRAIYEANCHILQLTDSLNAATRERDELAVLAELSDGYRRERDEARALNPPGDASWATFAMHVARERDALEDRLEQMTCERDEAHAQLAASSSLYRSLAAINAMARERDEARAQLAALRAERDALRVRT